MTSRIMDKLELKDEYFLTLAVAQAHCAWQEGNAPIGAVLISQDGQVLAQNYNQAFTTPGLIYHAEMMIFLQNQDFFLQNRWTTTLYTTLEPCVMCLSTALIHHVKRIVWLVDDYWSGGTRCYNDHSSYLCHSQCELVPKPIPYLKAQIMPLLVTFYSRKWPAERVAAMLREQ
jgi:tRNA(adenine34) deaminase